MIFSMRMSLRTKERFDARHDMLTRPSFVFELGYLEVELGYLGVFP